MEPNREFALPVPTSGAGLPAQLENSKMQNLRVGLREAKAENLGQWMKSEPESKPRPVAVAVFFFLSRAHGPR